MNFIIFRYLKKRQNMDELDELVMRKRRDRLYNRTSAPLAFLIETMFHYHAPPPIPGAAQPAYVPMHAPQPFTPPSAGQPANARTTPEGADEVRRNLDRGASKTAERAADYLEAGAASKAATVAATRGKDRAATTQVTTRSMDEASLHNTRSKQSRIDHFLGVGSASSVGYDSEYGARS
jgi:hypothetical protein